MIILTAPVHFNVTLNRSYLHQTKSVEARRKHSLPLFNGNPLFALSRNSIFNCCSLRGVVTRVSGDGLPGGGGGGGGGDGDFDFGRGPTRQQDSTRIEESRNSSSSFGDSYVALFVRMLGLDNDPLDREQAVVALWKYSLGGRKCIDNIMQFEGCINLIINLLNSESNSTCEAAAGLLRSISLFNVYRDIVAESGTVEEITALLSQPSLTSEVKEQVICTLWNLSIDEKFRVKIANADIVLLLTKVLDDESTRVKEAAGGVLANLALSHSNHSLMVEAGVIPKLAEFLKSDIEDETRIIRKEARNALVELAKNDYYRILVIEEGLVPVPLIGAAAYRSYAPVLRSWPTLPDGTSIERTSTGPSRYGASELLLGLNVNEDNVNMEEAKMKAMIGRSKQQFLARTGAIEVEDAKSPESSSNRQFTLLPWTDGAARLVLILELEDESAISRAAKSIADACINEHMRNSFKEAGAVKHLIRLLHHKNEDIKFSVVCALEKLSISNSVCQLIEAEGVMSPLVDILKNSETFGCIVEKVLDLMARILDPAKEMKSEFYEGPVNGSKKALDAAYRSRATTGLTASTRQLVLDSTLVTHLVEILKHPFPSLQTKAVAVLECIAVIDIGMDIFTPVNIETGLDAVLQQEVLAETEADAQDQPPEQYALQVEEAGLAISVACRLLARFLDSEQLCRSINSNHYTKLLRRILKSNIPLHYKDWVAACLVKLSSLYGPNAEFDSPINMEVTLHETIPRLTEQIKSLSPESQEAAVVELNRIISEGVVDATRAIASEGIITPLVRLLEQGSERAVDAALSLLYNLSMESENHSVIVAAGAVPALRRIILAQRPQWKRALHLLRILPT